MFAAALLVAAAAGCGGDDSPDATITETIGTTGTADGAEVWATAGCGGCHVLAAANGNGRAGPNLDERQPSAERVAAKVRSGGGGMPSFDDRLSDEEIAAVAEYVASSAG